MRLDFFLILMVYLTGLSSDVLGFFGLSSPRKVFENPTVAHYILNGTSIPQMDNLLPSFDGGYLCHALDLSGKQRKLCTNEDGYPEVLMESLVVASRACQEEFSEEKWNCPLDFTRRNLLRQATKEAAILHAISAAGLLHTTAKACSSGRLERCSCEFNHIPLEVDHQKSNWVWGGCGDNLRAARKMTEPFLRAAPVKMSQPVRQFAEHNTKLGMKAVQRTSELRYRCHGVSGSCALKTYYRVLPPFQAVQKKLHEDYDHAKAKLASTFQKPAALATTVADTGLRSYVGMPSFRLVTTELRSLESRKLKRPELDMNLWYQKGTRVDFCRRSKHSHGTSGRACVVGAPWKRRTQEKDHRSHGVCNSLCCGKNRHVARYENVSKRCNCSYVAFNVSCAECREREMRYYCL